MTFHQHVYHVHNMASYASNDVPPEVQARFLDKDQVKRLLPDPIEYIPPRHHVAYPSIYTTTVADSNQMRKLNTGFNWKNALFGSRGAPGYYFPKFPQRPHIGGNVEYMDLVFTLPNERVPHGEFQEEHSASGSVELTITKGQLLPFVGDKIDVKRRDFHLMPKHIVLLDVHSTLPITLDVTLKSKVGNKDFNCWSQPRGVTNASDPVQRANKFTHLVLAPNFSGAVADSKNTMFVAGDEYNNPDFSEYINVDFDSLKKQLSQLKYTNDSMPVFRFICPLADETNFSLPFWFLLNEWSEVRIRTAKVGWNRPELKLNHILKDGLNEYIMVSSKILLEILEQRADEHKHSKYLMNVTEITLELKPLLGERGWKEYKKIADARSAYDSGNEMQYARFTATVRIAYERYDGATPETDDVNNSLNNLNVREEVAPNNSIATNSAFWG